MKIQGFDDLQRQLEQAQKALQELPDEIDLRFNPDNPTSVETAIAEMKLAVERKVSRYRSNPIVKPLIEGLIADFEQQILQQATIAMTQENQTVNGDSEQQIFRNIENTVNDLRRSDRRSFDRHIKKLSRQLHSDGLDIISNSLKEKVDLNNWIEKGSSTGGSFVGSAQLIWPENHEEELGLVIALTDKFAEGDAGEPHDFAYKFFYVGNNLTSNIQHMVSEVYVPFARDYIDYVKTKTGTSEMTMIPKRAVDPASRKIFVVHGHDEGAKEATARFLEALDFKPIILHEQANRGRTIIEKIESNSDVGFAIVLLTPDDIGGSKDHPDKLIPRARQNVVLELGYFIGLLGRSRVVALKRGEVEIPSDFDGVVYISYDSGSGWKQQLGEELQAAGYDLDWNRIMGRR